VRKGRVADRECHRNFIGEKIVRRVNMRPGVDVEISKAQKDELVLSGNSLENVSQCAADIQQICKVRNKDIRKVSIFGASGNLDIELTRGISSWMVCTSPRRATWRRARRGKERSGFVFWAQRSDRWFILGNCMCRSRKLQQSGITLLMIKHQACPWCFLTKTVEERRKRHHDANPLDHQH
jgi:hypothetical protein